MKYIIPDKSNMRPIGRTAWEQDTLWMVQSGAGAEFSFTGTHVELTILADEGRGNGEIDPPRLAVFFDNHCILDVTLSQSHWST